MKNRLHFIFNPVTLLYTFGIIIVSGEKLGFPIFLYYLLGLFEWHLEILIAILAVILLAVGCLAFKKTGQARIKGLLYIIATLLLIASILMVFLASYRTINNFKRSDASIITAALFGAVAVGFLILSIGKITRPVTHLQPSSQYLFSKSLWPYLIHPITLLVIFVCLPIYSERFSSIYLFYWIMGLFQGALFGIFSTLAVILLLTGYNMQTTKIKNALYLSGAIMILLSVFSFFASDVERDNTWISLSNPVSIICLIVLGILVLFFAGKSTKHLFLSSRIA